MFMNARYPGGTKLLLMVGALAAVFVLYLIGHARRGHAGGLVNIVIGLTQGAVVVWVISKASRKPQVDGGSESRGAP
jgi:hypothetical protein